MTVEIPLLRTSERNDFKRCPWLWQEAWLKGQTTVRTPTWSWFGTAWHKGMEARYPIGSKRGSVSDFKDALVAALENETRRIYTEGGEIEESEIVDAKELILAMADGYVEEYGKDKRWVVLHSEQSFQIDVPHPTDPSRPIVIYAGTWDMVVWDTIDQMYYVVDHKTRKAFPSNWEFYDINDQAGSYLWVAPEVLIHMGVLTKKEAKKIRGLVFNAARKHLPDLRVRDEEGRARNNPQKIHFYEALKDIYDLNPDKLPIIASLREMAAREGITVYGEVSARQPLALFHREYVERAPQERATQGRRVQDEAAWMEAVRNGTLRAFKTPTEDCVRCILFEYCQADEYDRDEGIELAHTILRHRDPYRDHRDAMEDGGVEVKMKGK